MSKVATSFYAVCRGRKVGVFTSREETQSLVQGFSGAKLKKFKTQREADRWYRSNLPRSSVNAKTATATPSTSTVTSPNAMLTSSSSTAATRASSKRSTSSISKPLPRPAPKQSPRPAPKQPPQSASKQPPKSTPKQSSRSISKPSTRSTSKTATIATPKLAQPLRVATPKNTAVDIVYTDGACKSNGSRGAAAGIGVWWGPNDPRNLSERCPGPQESNRAELVAILRALETAPRSSKTLIIRTDSESYQKGVDLLTKRFSDWHKNGGGTAGGKSVPNKELISYTLTLLEVLERSGRPVRLEHIKGHSGNVGNDGADALAVAGCSCPEVPERDWVRLKTSSNAVADLVRGTNPASRATSF